MMGGYTPPRPTSAEGVDLGAFGAREKGKPLQSMLRKKQVALISSENPKFVALNGRMLLKAIGQHMAMERKPPRMIRMNIRMPSSF